MAIITYSALITNISGKLGGNTLKRGKGNSIIFNTMRPTQRRTSRQHNIRGYISQLSVRWYSLTATEREMWNTFASLTPRKQSGINGFTMLNLKLLSAEHVSLTVKTAPPTLPSTPESVKELEKTIIDSTKNRLEWTAPDDVNTYVQVYYCVEPGYSFKNKEKWSLVETVSSTCLIVEHVHSYPTGTIIKYYARSMDTSGRVSPRTHKI